MKLAILTLVFLLYALIAPLSAQEVSISSELNIRNYFAYELLGEIDERYLVYRDKGFIKEIDVFNKYMEHSLRAELVLEKKRTDMISSVGLDTVFQIIYGYLEKDTMVMKMRRYDQGVSLVDSSTLAKIPKKDITRRINSVLSENKSKVLMYSLNKDENLDVYLYDNRLNRLAAHQLLVFQKNLNLKKRLRDIKLTNNGNLLLLLHGDEQFAINNKRDKLEIVYFDLGATANGITEIDLGDKFRKDVYLDYDNINNRVVICGLYSERKAKESKGIYLLSKPISELTEKESVNYIAYSEKLIDEVSRTKKKKNRIFENFVVKEIIKRQDGGILMILELSKEFSRRSSYSAGYDRTASAYNRRGWVDYYNEDIIIASITPDAKIDWTKILYKKQFSQDDEAIYSSFYVMKTPSRMRLLYNDEIKKSNTVSEYILDPVGNVARNSLLSTEDQSMKLRFKDAVQINNKELLVPSENNFELTLVKISY